MLLLNEFYYIYRCTNNLLCFNLTLRKGNQITVSCFLTFIGREKFHNLKVEFGLARPLDHSEKGCAPVAAQILADR